MSRVVEQVRLNIHGEEVVVDRCEDGTFRKPAYLLLEREVVGVNPSSRPNSKTRGGKGFDTHLGQDSAGFQLETAPATEAAKQFEGMGTALKPAWEPFLVGRKPA